MQVLFGQPQLKFMSTMASAVSGRPFCSGLSQFQSFHFLSHDAHWTFGERACAIDVPFRADYSRVTYLCSLTSYESLFTVICCERKRLWWGVRAVLSCESKGEQKAACCAIIESDNSSGFSLRACDLPGHSFVVRFIVLGMNYLPVGQPLNLIRRLLGTPLTFISLLY